MGEKIEFKEMIYESKDIVIKAVICSIILILAFRLGINEDVRLLLLVFNLMIIMGSFTIIFLIMSILKVYSQDYFKYLIFSYIVYIIITIIYYLGTIDANIIFNMDEVLKKISFVNLIVAFTLGIKFKICYKEKNKVCVIMLIILGFIGLILSSLPGEYIGGIGVILITLIVLYKYLYLLRGYKFIKDDNINHLRLNIYIFITAEVLLLSNYFLDKKETILISVIYFLFILFIINFVCDINKIINNPYKHLFKDLYEETTKLSKINKKLIDKNLELERKQIIVKRKEKMFKLFFEKAPVAILIINIYNKRVVYCNKIFLNILDEDNIRDIINKKVDGIIKISREGYGMKSDLLYSGEIIKDGKKKSLEIRVIDVNKENGTATLIAYDSTEKRKIEETKEKIKKELLEEEIKREFLSNITHDLKTPVNVIYSATQLEKILIENENIEEIAKYNFLSKQNCKALISLTNNLIDSSKMNKNYMKPKLTVLNIVDIVENTVQSLAEYAKINKIDLIFDTNEEEVFCNIDEEFLTRIITNLVSNSIKFTDEGGEIRVRVENLFYGWVKVEVVDNGVGMDDYFLKIAFERYSMDREEGSNVSGTGIGLFVVKKFVDILKGQIRINSVVGVGTKIEIFFKIER